MAIFTTRGYLHPTAPFDFSQSLHFLERSTASQEAFFSDNGILSCTLAVNGSGVLAQMRSVGSVSEPKLEYRLTSLQPLPEITRLTALDQLARFLGLYDNISQFYLLAREDSRFAPLVEQLYGYHQTTFLSPFSAAVWTLWIQHGSLSDAQKRHRVIRELCGPPLPFAGSIYQAFPEPEQVLNAHPERLKLRIRNQDLFEKLLLLSRYFHWQQDDFWAHAPEAELCKALRELGLFAPEGITFFITRGLGRWDPALLNGQRFVRHYNSIYQQENGDNISGISGSYGNWRHYWAHYLQVSGMIVRESNTLYRA